MPAARTRIRTVPGRTAGSGASRTSMTSGDPCRGITKLLQGAKSARIATALAGQALVKLDRLLHFCINVFGARPSRNPNRGKDFSAVVRGAGRRSVNRELAPGRARLA